MSFNLIVIGSWCLGFNKEYKQCAVVMDFNKINYDFDPAGISGSFV